MGRNFPDNGWGEYSPLVYGAPGSGVDETFFRFYIFLQKPFEISDQLKLVGVYADTNRNVPTGRAGIQPDGTNYSRVMLALSPNLMLHFYVYHMDQGGTFGSIWNSRFILVPGTWYCLELQASLNTPGMSNGRVRAWVNGALVGERDNIQFRTAASLKFHTWTLEAYHGGSQSYPQDVTTYMDNVVISRAYIGPIGTPSSPNPDASPNPDPNPNPNPDRDPDADPDPVPPDGRNGGDGANGAIGLKDGSCGETGFELLFSLLAFPLARRQRKAG